MDKKVTIIFEKGAIVFQTMIFGGENRISYIIDKEFNNLTITSLSIPTNYHLKYFLEDLLELTDGEYSSNYTVYILPDAYKELCQRFRRISFNDFFDNTRIDNRWEYSLNKHQLKRILGYEKALKQIKKVIASDAEIIDFNNLPNSISVTARSIDTGIINKNTEGNDKNGCKRDDGRTT